MTKLSSILWMSGIAALCATSALVSCTASTGSDDDDGGEAGSGPADAGESSGGTSGSGGSGGNAGTNGGASGAAGESGEAGSGGDPSAAGAGGGPAENVCDTPGAGEENAEGRGCTEYCADFFTNCEDFSDEAGFSDEAACLASCQFFGDAQLCCRASNVQAASTCAAAAGDVTCN